MPMGSECPTGAQPVRAGIGQLDWLAGTWIGTAGSVTFEERWTPAAGGAMLAVARTVEENRMVAFEFLRIVERNSGLVYIAQPNGRPPTEFTLTGLGDRSATFENPAHDFPKVIRYSVRADGTMEARISGDGPQKPQMFVFRRQD
jgi:hypothetical protein